MWFLVNELLPVALQKSLPDRPPEMPSTDIHEGEHIFFINEHIFHFNQSIVVSI